jgi:hypothetical protein
MAGRPVQRETGNTFPQLSFSALFQCFTRCAHSDFSGLRPGVFQRFSAVARSGRRFLFQRFRCP